MVGCRPCAKQASMAAQELPQGWTTLEDSGFEQLEYTGGNRSTTTFTGITGRRYRFGNNDEAKVSWVHPEDANNFINVKHLPFKRVPHLTQIQKVPTALVAPTM